MGCPKIENLAIQIGCVTRVLFLIISRMVIIFDLLRACSVIQ